MTCTLELVLLCYVTVTDARFRHAWERNHKLCCQPRIMRGTPAGTSKEKKNKSSSIYQDSRWQYHDKVASFLLSRPNCRNIQQSAVGPCWRWRQAAFPGIYELYFFVLLLLLLFSLKQGSIKVQHVLCRESWGLRLSLLTSARYEDAPGLQADLSNSFCILNC